MFIQMELSNVLCGYTHSRVCVGVVVGDVEVRDLLIMSQTNHNSTKRLWTHLMITYI